MTVRMPRSSTSPIGLEPDEQPDAALQVDHVLLAGPQAVEVVDGVEHGDVAVGLPARRELLRRAREEQPVERRPAVGGQRRLVGVRQLDLPAAAAAGPPAPGSGRARASRRAGRPARRARKPTTESGTSKRSGCSANSAGSAPTATRCSARSPTTFERRRDLDQPAEDPVGGRVHGLDLLELLPQAERDRLLAQVGQLAAGDLVVVDPAGRRRQAGLERRVDPADRLPVGLQVDDGPQVEPGVALGVRERRHQRRHRRLARGAGHRGAGGVDRVDAGVDGGEQGGQLAAGGVVGVQVHRQVEPLAQRGDQRRGRGRAAAGRPCP